MTADRYVDGTYLDANPTWHAEDSAWKAAHVGRGLDEAGVRWSSAVDVGCGVGAVLSALAAAHPDATSFAGWDVSPHAVEEARRRSVDPRLRFEVGGIDAVPDGAADVLLLLDVVEHVEDPFAFLRAAARKAAHLVVHLPLDLYAYAVLRGGPLVAGRSGGHLHAFTKDTALLLLADVGLDVRHWHYTPWGVDMAAGATGARAAVLRSLRRAGLRRRPDLTVRALGGASLLVVAGGRPMTRPR